MPLLGLTTPFPFPPPSRLPNLRPATATSPSSSSPVEFHYPQADPSIRWPDLHLHFPHLPKPHQPLTNTNPNPNPTSSIITAPLDKAKPSDEKTELPSNFESLESKSHRTHVKKLSKLALKRAHDWRERVRLLSNRILSLPDSAHVADVLDHREPSLQVTPTDLSFVVKQVGQTDWRRALEAYEWLTLHRQHAPGPRLLSAILGVLGRARQDSLAEEVFLRCCSDTDSEPAVQVYNAMMGVYARTGRFAKVRKLLDSMRDHGLEPDLVSFNTLINARSKAHSLGPGVALQLLNDVRRSGLRPDTITYNTLISACSQNTNLEDAMKVFEEMLKSECQPDLWTYNAMISVCGRCSMAQEAERLFDELHVKGFIPDAVTYNALLYSFARAGDVAKVEKVCNEMVHAGFKKDEITYNTIINMYGKRGRLDIAFCLYNEMKIDGCDPDVFTYTVLIDLLGKAERVLEASEVMSRMVEAGLKPNVKTFNALICGYAKAGMRIEAKKTFDHMIRSGIEPDCMAYSVMLDVLLRSDGEIRKVMELYRSMVKAGFYPDEYLYQVMLQSLMEANEEDKIHELIKDMEMVSFMNVQSICSVLVKAGCFFEGAEMLKQAVSQGHKPDHEILSLILNAYESLGRSDDGLALLGFVHEQIPSSLSLTTESFIMMLCRNKKIEAAIEEYNKLRFLGYESFEKNPSLHEYLISCCIESGLLPVAFQFYSDMSFLGIRPSQETYKILISAYCKLNYPETAEDLMQHAMLNDPLAYINIIETYGKLKLWEKAEAFVEKLRHHEQSLDRRVWNSLISAYAESGRYEKARAIFNHMMKHGPYPSVDSINGLINALIIDKRLDEMYVVIQELQDMDFKISKSTILLMLDAFARENNIFEVRKIYSGMKAAGYLPNMHLYRSMIALFTHDKRVGDVESMVEEMERAGLKPDIFIFNSLLKMYTKIGAYKKTSEVYQKILRASLRPDEDTYNTLIIMYSRDVRPEEGLTLLSEMRKLGLELKLDSYKSLLAACVKAQLLDQAEELFSDIRSKGYKLDRLIYHLMLKIYRNSGNHIKAENLLELMKEDGVEPTIATMHLLMLSYGTAHQPKEADNILNNLRNSGMVVTTLPYSTVIDAYLKNGEYDNGIAKLLELKKQGIQIDHRIWTCFVRAASFCEKREEAFLLLGALRDRGFDLPIRLLTDKSDSLVSEVLSLLEELGPLEDNAAFNFVNAIEDLLWAFEKRATASWIFQLATKTNIYRNNVFRVLERDWGADFRKMSGGAALVGLTLWLDHMQDASLQGCPESPKSVVLITGAAEYNKVSLNKTLKAYLWEMGSPFLPCKSRTGILVAKAHSLRMWLKESTFCMDLELKDSSTLPCTNSMRLIDGYFMRAGLVPAFKDIEERLGEIRPKKFARLALLSEDSRDKVITKHIEGTREKMEKARKNGSVGVRRRRPTRLRTAKFMRWKHKEEIDSR
ncbi:Pentatricopeptide repeat-containing protein [Rhynchospora pubera]|uniref:Pentatricopeptide repeat-containing protein n=1 Tax=Rhynchospora pubera TaxID=906938 RepID=A0AAV8FNU7_9POAL|nr:Pentatricopeptide repeat-containing protein [Rhynchospora pubera]